MSKTIEFFFDLSSPWTCLAFHNIRPMLEQTGATVRWRPFLVGGVHNQVNATFVESRNTELTSPKWLHSGRALMDWAAHSGVTMNFPGKHHPLRSVHAMRVCCLLEKDQPALLRFMEATFAAYFTDMRNLDDPAVLIELATDCGLDGQALAAGTQEQACKDHLRANTDEAIARGAFGSPSVFVPLKDGSGERMYFGNDQLPLVKWAIETL
jgi:2-hydroxychromene-2-carboxylate isomerase